MDLWKPVFKGDKHPKLIQLKQDAKFKKMREKAEKKASADSWKRYYSQRAAAAENRTNRNLGSSNLRVKATRNSGRTRMDGDHLVEASETIPVTRLTLDTKLQTALEHPRVHLDELDKVRADAIRAGTAAGGLLIRNSRGRGVVVFAEEDFRNLFV